MRQAFSNRFLDAVRARGGTDLAAACEHVSLPFEMPLFTPDTPPRYVHFLTSGVSSVVNTIQSGNAVEVGMFGCEGFPETMHLLGPQRGNKVSMMQVSGSCLRMNFDRFRELFHADAAVRDVTLRLVQFENLQVSQIAACNGLHELEERLARWLLMVQDRRGSPELPLTQEFLGNMLGSRRSTVTTTASILQRAGMIDYSRGMIRVERRDRLEDVACECYGVLRTLRENLYQ